MAKEVVKKIKLQIAAGKATPAPPVGTVLGPAGINLQDFCTKYNDATRDRMGDILPVEITIYDDRSFDFVVKTPPTSFLLKKYTNVQKGSTTGAKQTVATINNPNIFKAGFSPSVLFSTNFLKSSTKPISPNPIVAASNGIKFLATNLSDSAVDLE